MSFAPSRVVGESQTDQGPVAGESGVCQGRDMTIGWGICSTGKIATGFARDLALVPGATLAAVGSRSVESRRRLRPRARPRRHRAHGSVEELAADPGVDVVYVASPHTLHPVHARAALEAGKAVLCEKPLTLNARQAQATRRPGPRAGSVLHGGHVDGLQPGRPGAPRRAGRRSVRHPEAGARRPRLRRRPAGRRPDGDPRAGRRRPAGHGHLPADLRPRDAG